MNPARTCRTRVRTSTPCCTSACARAVLHLCFCVMCCRCPGGGDGTGATGRGPTSVVACVHCSAWRRSGLRPFCLDAQRPGTRTRGAPAPSLFAACCSCGGAADIGAAACGVRPDTRDPRRTRTISVRSLSFVRAAARRRRGAMVLPPETPTIAPLHEKVFPETPRPGPGRVSRCGGRGAQDTWTRFSVRRAAGADRGCDCNCNCSGARAARPYVSSDRGRALR